MVQSHDFSTDTWLLLNFSHMTIFCSNFSHNLRAVPGVMDLSSLPSLSHTQLLQILSHVVAELIRRSSISTEGTPIPPPSTPPLAPPSGRLQTPPRGQCGFRCQYCNCERACTRRGVNHSNHKCWHHRHER